MSAATLEEIGLDRGSAAALIDELAAGASRALDPEDAGAVSATAGVLHVAIVAALQARRFADELAVLLDWLEERLDDLSQYDGGRFWHLRGLSAWRRDNLVFVATRALNRSVAELERLDTPRARSYLARVHDSFGQMLHYQGMLAEARYELELAHRHRDPADHFGTALTCGNLGRLCLDLGEFAEADKHLSRDLTIMGLHQPDDRRLLAQLHSHVADCKARTGAIDEATRHYHESYALACGGNPVGVAHAVLGFGRIALVRGRATAALEVAHYVLAGIAVLDLHPRMRASLEAVAHRLAGDALSGIGDLARAAGAYHSAIGALANGDATPIERAEILRGLARVQHARRETDRSIENLRRALTALDATSAQLMRREIESELEGISNLAWIAHSAGRFIGQTQLEDVLRKAGFDGYQGEQQDLTIMFSDIRGFTALSLKLTPTELVLLLNDFLTAMTRCIEHHNGAVDKFIGDSVMAVFPRDRDAPCDPVGAALAMREELRRINRTSGRYNHKIGELSIGIGLHAGTVISGLIGSPQRRSLTVIGDPVNTASRLEGMTKQLGASILVTDAALAAIDRSRYLLRPLGRFSPKGRPDPITVYDLMGVRDRSPASQAMLREIARVEAALGALQSGDFRRAEAELAVLALDAAGAARATGYQMLAARARELDANRPADWTGVIALHEK